MKQRCCALFRGVESFVRRHLYMVCRWAIEGPVASDCDANAARLHDQIGLGNALDDRFRGLGLAKLRDSVELRSVEDDIGAQQRDGSPLFVVAPDFELSLDKALMTQRVNFVLDVDIRTFLDTASYCPPVHEVRSKSSGCRAIALIRSPFCLPRTTWMASSSPRLTRCNTV